MNVAAVCVSANVCVFDVIHIVRGVDVMYNESAVAITIPLALYSFYPWNDLATLVTTLVTALDNNTSKNKKVYEYGVSRPFQSHFALSVFSL